VQYSVIILVEDKQEDFFEFVNSLYQFMSEIDSEFEIIIIVNGVGAFLSQQFQMITADDKRIKFFEFYTKTSSVVCLKAGLKECLGDIIILYGSYQQITNESLMFLIDSVHKGTDIASPWRQQRVDNIFNQIQSKVFNIIVNMFTRTNFHDLGCKVKVLRREVLENVDIYGDMYQFLPILANMKGYKTEEVKCDHYKDHGKTGIYGANLYFNRLLEIFTLYFNTRFTRKPLRFFSTVGVIFILCGFTILGYVFFQKIFLGLPIGDRPVLLLSILFSVIGVQAASVGLLGEIIAFVHGRKRKEYTIEKQL